MQIALGLSDTCRTVSTYGSIPLDRGPVLCNQLCQSKVKILDIVYLKSFNFCKAKFLWEFKFLDGPSYFSNFND